MIIVCSDWARLQVLVQKDSIIPWILSPQMAPLPVDSTTRSMVEIESVTGLRSRRVSTITSSLIMLKEPVEITFQSLLRSIKLKLLGIIMPSERSSMSVSNPKTRETP